MTPLPPKKQVALALLQQSSVFVHLDPRRERVNVPGWFKNQPQLVLQIGLNMAVRIPDLEVSDEAVSCTLSFNRTPFFCYLPWTAIYALVGEDGRGMVWPEDVPSEVTAQSSSRPPAAGDSLRSAASAGRRSGADRSKPRLRSVPPPPKAPILPAELSSTERRARPERLGAERLGTDRLRTPGLAESFAAAYTQPGRLEPPGFPLAEPLEASVRSRDGQRRQLPSYLRVVK